MSSQITKIAAVAVIAIVVVAGAAFFIISNNNEDSAPIESPLMIRGNADNNYKIDSNDMSILQDVMNGNKALSDYPLADVNNDGKVDDTDKQILQDIIDRKEGITVYVLSLDREGKEVTVPVKYPLRNVVTFATNMEMPTLYAGGGPYEAGYFTRSYMNAQKSIVSTAKNLDGSQRTITDANWTSFTTLDAELRDAGKGGVGALLVDYSGIAQITTSRAGDLAAAGIPMLSYKSADSLVESATVITLSFLFGKDTEPIGQKYAQLADKVVDKIKTKLGSLTDEQKTTYMCFTMYIYICEDKSSFNTSAAFVYGLPYSKVNSEFASKYTGTSSKIMSNVEALSNYTDVDVLINNRSMDWADSADKAKSVITETWDHSNDAKTGKSATTGDRKSVV